MTATLIAITPKRIRLGPNAVKSNLRRGMHRYLDEVKKITAAYPPKQPGQTYVRTGHLGRSWVKFVTPDGAKGTLINTAKYGVFAHGPRYGSERESGEYQSRLLRARKWRSLADVVRITKPRFKRIVNRAIYGGERDE